MQRLGEDAALLERALREGWPKDHEGLRALLERRPGWAALLEGPDGVPPAHGEEAELDRRLTDEALALARDSAARRAPLGRPWPWRVLTIAAAVLLGVVWAAWFARPSPQPDPTQLLGGGGSTDLRPVVCQPPSAEAPAFGRLDWDAKLPLTEDQSYEVVVRDCATGAELARTSFGYSSVLSGEPQTHWTLDPAETRDWPDCIEWSVSLLDANGFRIASDKSRLTR